MAEENAVTGRVEKLYGMVSEIRLTTYATLARQDALERRVSEIADRPPPAFPIWIILVCTIPTTLIALFLLALVVEVMARGAYL